MVSVFSPPDRDLLKKSFHTVYACTYQGEAALQVIKVTNAIESVVAMIPFFQVRSDGEIIEPNEEYFLAEQPSLEVARFFGFNEYGEDSDAEDDDPT